jgi:beta-glucosidase
LQLAAEYDTMRWKTDNGVVRRGMKIGLFAGVMLLSHGMANASCPLPTPVEQARIDALLSRMSLAEKVSQMRIFHANAANRLESGSSGIALDPSGQLLLAGSITERFANGIAGIKNPGETIDPVSAARLTNALQRRIIDTSPNKIPALFVAEAYNGLDASGSTRFGRPIAMASTWNPQLVGQAWDVVGREARLRGFHMIHSPVADLHRDPRFGRMSEGFGEDTVLTSQMVVSAVRGVQGNQTGLKSTHIGAVTKHFVGYGQVDGGRNFASVTVSPRDLEDQLLPPFRAAVIEGCTLGIMPSHGDINGVATHGNKALLTDKLRGEWGFDGYVVSDAEDVARLGFFMGVASDDKAAARLGLEAGVDIDLYSERAFANLPQMAANDPELLPLIDQAARRVLMTKMKLGLFDKPYVDPKDTARGTRTKAALDLTLKLDLEAAILLKNENALLPLNTERRRRIALVGPLVEIGTEAAFQSVFGPQTQFNVATGMKLTNEDPAAPQLASAADNAKAFDQAIAAARQSDLAIVFIGDDEFTAKEAFFKDGVRGDRATLDPVGQQAELVATIKAGGKPLIVVLKHRRTLAIGAISAQADALLDVWEQGERGDEATAMLLSGKADPSGRLPVTVPRHVGQLPIHYAQKRINFKKAYLFEEDGPLYPFGYGLSYTQFAYSGLTLSATQMASGKPINASVTVRNTGPRAGQEVVQLYLSDPVATVTRPIKELKGFQKIALQPGESRTVSFAITPDMLSYTGADMKADPGYGRFIIEIAPNAAGGGETVEAEFNP